ncbi:MAG: nitronate monooxygenase [Pseudomonadota bacterium]
MTDHPIDLSFGGRLRIPLIVAPMFLVSSPELAIAACGKGVMGSFPAHSTRTRDDFAKWLELTEAGLQDLRNQGIDPAPYAVNLVVNETNPRFEGDLELCIENEVEMILTSKGAPTDVFDRIHEYGGVAFHDVASRRHAEKALAAGADGIIAVCNGAGGHTGQQNPFGLVNEIRQLTDKPIVLAGALSTGQDIVAARAMGADMAYMGTRFIACPESLAPDAYGEMLVQSGAKDVFYTEALDGYPMTVLVPSLANADMTLEDLKRLQPGEKIGAHQAKARFKSIWSAGHGVGAVSSCAPAAEVCDEIIDQYEVALERVRAL